VPTYLCQQHVAVARGQRSREQWKLKRFLPLTQGQLCTLKRTLRSKNLNKHHDRPAQRPSFNGTSWTPAGKMLGHHAPARPRHSAVPHHLTFPSPEQLDEMRDGMGLSGPAGPHRPGPASALCPQHSAPPASSVWTADQRELDVKPRGSRPVCARRTRLDKKSRGTHPVRDWNAIGRKAAKVPPRVCVRGRAGPAQCGIPPRHRRSQGRGWMVGCRCGKGLRAFAELFAGSCGSWVLGS
jgi:hypothetical protein